MCESDVSSRASKFASVATRLSLAARPLLAGFQKVYEPNALDERIVQGRQDLDLSWLLLRE